MWAYSFMAHFRDIFYVVALALHFTRLRKFVFTPYFIFHEGGPYHIETSPLQKKCP